VDTAKVGLRLGSQVVKIKPGANLGVLGSTRALDLTKDQTQDSVEVQTQALARVQVQTTTNKAQMVDPTMATQPLPHPALMLSLVQVPSMETMTILHPLDVAAGDVVAQLGVALVDVVVGGGKALEASSQEKVAIEERSDMCLRSLSKAIHVNTAEDLIVIIFFIIYPLIVL